MTEHKTQTADDGTVTGEVVMPDVEPENLPAKLPDNLTQFITSNVPELAEKPTDGLQRIVQQVLDAATPEAVLTPVEVMQASDIIGSPFILLDIDLQQSDYDAGSPFYVSLACDFPPGGDVRVVNCGHKKVIAQAVKLKQMDALPRPVKFITRGKSQQGTPMLELTMWDENDGPPPF